MCLAAFVLYCTSTLYPYNTPNLWACNALSIWPLVRSSQRQMLPFWRGQHAPGNLAATPGVLPAGLRQIRLPTLRETSGTRGLLHMYILHGDMIATCFRVVKTPHIQATHPSSCPENVAFFSSCCNAATTDSFSFSSYL